MTTTPDAEESTWQPAYPNGNGNGNGADRGGEGPRTQPRTRVRTRGNGNDPDQLDDDAEERDPFLARMVSAVLDPIRQWTGRQEARRRSRYTDDEAAAPEVGRKSFWQESPASLADLAAYTRSGAYAPGERSKGWERAGKAYGYLAAIPLTVLLYSAAFVIQRPGRVAILAIVVALAFVPDTIASIVGGAG